MNKEDFLEPIIPYRGQCKPQNLIFNANLQEFSQKVNYICALETNGKVSPDEAYEQIKTLWNQLQRSKQQLGIDEPPSRHDSQ